MKVDRKDRIEIAIGLLKEYRETGDFNAITHADMIIHPMATVHPKREPCPEKQSGKKPRKELHKEIGRRIREFRMESGMSQEELGQRIGLCRLSIIAYEGGTTRVSIPTLYMLADVFDKTIFDLLP